MKKSSAQQGYDFRRANERKRYNKEIIFSHSQGIYRGIIKNISLGGARIETDSLAPFHKGERVIVSIPYTTGDKNVKRKGRIVWLNDSGFAIEFL